MDKNFEPLNEIYQSMTIHNSSKNQHITENTYYLNQSNNQCEQKDLNSQDEQKEIQQVVDQNNIVENEYFDEDGYKTYRIQTERKGKRNKIQVNNQEQQPKQQFEDISTIYENKQSIVGLKFDPNQSEFIVEKQNLNEKELFEKEYKILKLLNGSKITLDVISTINDKQLFQQIAGKTNLQTAKQNEIGEQQILICYFIQLDKLNKMHEIGIAHSDIKPQNIVLDFNNEPFFIDFGGSVFLSDENDFKNYLKFFTPKYNLEIYFEIFNQQDKIYKPRQLESQQDIKLCDIVQLSLTFLYLICDNQIQKKLFCQKQYNQLFENIIQNQQIIFENMEFGERMKRFENMKQNHLNILNKQLYMPENQESIIASEKRRMIFIFYISRILNQADPKINIIEYEQGQIFEIDEELRKYELKYLNDIVFDEKHNIYTIYRIDKFNIQFIYFLDKAGYKLQIDPKYTFITPQYEKKEYQFINEKYKIDEYFQKLINQDEYFSDGTNQIFNICKYIKAHQIRNLDISNKPIKDIHIVLRIFIQFSLKILYPFQLKFKLEDDDSLDSFITNHQKIFFLKIPNFCVKNFEIFEDGIIIQARKDIYEKIQKNKKQQCENFVNVILHLSDTDYSFKRYFEIIKNNYEIKQVEIFYPQEDVISFVNPKQHQLIKQSYQNDTQQQNENQFAFDYLILNSYIFKMRQSGQKKIMIKMVDQKIFQEDMWFEIQNVLTRKNNYYIEIITINCLFSKQIAKLLKLFYQQYHNQVKYEFKDQCIEWCKNNSDLQYYIKVESSSLNEQELKIFFCVPKNNKEQNEKNNKEQNEKIKQNILIQNQHETIYETIEQQIKYQSKPDQPTLYIYNENIQQKFKDDRINKFPNLKELKIEFGKQIRIQEFVFVNKQIKIKYKNKKNLIENINQIIKDIRSKNQYTWIQIYYNPVWYYHFKNFKYDLEFECVSNNADQYLSLSLAILNNYNLYNENKYQKQIIKYKYFSIQQSIQYTKKFKDLFFFEELIIYQNSKSENSEDLRINFITYEITHFDYENILDIDHNTILDCINHFFNNSALDLFFANEKISQKFFIILHFNYCQSEYILEQFHKFFVIEKFFPQNKLYFFKISKQLFIECFNQIYETLETFQFEQKLYFYLQSYDTFLYDEVYYLLIRFNYLNNIQSFFKIDISYYVEKESQFINDFSDYMQIAKIDGFLTLQNKQQQLNQNITKKIQVMLKLNKDQNQKKYYIPFKNQQQQNKEEEKRTLELDQLKIKFNEKQQQQIKKQEKRTLELDQLEIKFKKCKNTFEDENEEYLDNLQLKKFIESEI